MIGGAADALDELGRCELVGVVARDAVQRDDEVVACAGRGDVQQAGALELVHLLVDRPPCPRSSGPAGPCGG